MLYFAAASSPSTGLWSHRFPGDSDVYGYYAQKVHDGQAPYRDFQIEYPPGALVAFVPPVYELEALHHAGLTGLTYTDVFKATMLIWGLLIVGVVATTAKLLWRDPRRVLVASTVVGLSPLVLGPISLSWYDTWPTLLTIGATALFVRRHLLAAFALLAAAVASKLFALVLLPLFVAQGVRRLGWRRTLLSGIGFLGTTALCFGSAAILSLRGARYPFDYLLKRPVEIESTAGSIVGLFHVAGWLRIKTHESYGSVNFKGSEAAALGLAIAILGGLVLVALWWRSAAVELHPTSLIACSTAAIAITLGASKVFSPQYLVWLVPFVALTLQPAALLALTSALVLTRIWFPEHWSVFNNIQGLFVLAAPRNLAVCLVAIFLLFRTSSRRRAESGARLVPQVPSGTGQMTSL